MTETIRRQGKLWGVRVASVYSVAICIYFYHPPPPPPPPPKKQKTSILGGGGGGGNENYVLFLQNLLICFLII